MRMWLALSNFDTVTEAEIKKRVKRPRKAVLFTFKCRLKNAPKWVTFFIKHVKNEILK